VGHSYGGYTALAAAGARIDTGAFNGACETAHATDDPLVFLCDALQDRMSDMADRLYRQITCQFTYNYDMKNLINFFKN
jgi:predicted dienelactone hydrolase